jgi:ParB-like chromosome segregation protein Spo0J
VKIGDYETHPLADAFPLLEGDQYEGFKLSIKQNGMQLKKGVLFKGRILDGRNRYRASLELGLKFEWRVYEGNDPLGLVMALNYDRQHYNESQRAVVATKLETFTHGGSRRKSADGVTRKDAAKVMNVSERLVAAARLVMNKGIDDLLKAVERGELAVSRAAEIANLPHAEQRAELEREINPGKQREAKLNQLGGGEPIAVLFRAFMRTCHELKASVKVLPASDGRALSIGFKGQVITVTLSQMKDVELVA